MNVNYRGNGIVWDTGDKSWQDYLFNSFVHTHAHTHEHTVHIHTHMHKYTHGHTRRQVHNATEESVCKSEHSSFTPKLQSVASWKGYHPSCVAPACLLHFRTFVLFVNECVRVCECQTADYCVHVAGALNHSNVQKGNQTCNLLSDSQML